MWKFCHSTDTLLRAITDEFEQCGFPDSQELTIWMLEQGKLLILIDGLNEATLSQKHLSQHLQDFVKAYPQNRYIVSSRLASYQNSLGQFLEIVLQPWGDLHVQEYIHKWFAIAYETNFRKEEPSQMVLQALNTQSLSFIQDLSSEKAQQCWQVLQLNQFARELAKSPLYLSLLCLLWNQSYSFPSNISSLYQKAIHVVLEENVLKYQLIDNEKDWTLDKIEAKKERD
jgi:hypothetical protein